MSRFQQVTVILNPAAGRKTARRAADDIRRMLDTMQLDHRMIMTDGPKHATEIARSLPEDSRLVIAMGGDGTAHEVANGMTGSSNTLGVLAIGSGNDFGRILRAPKSVVHLSEYIKKGEPVQIDVGRVLLGDATGNVSQMTMMNCMGIGFDAEVSNYSRRVKWLRGLPLYIFSLLRTLPSYVAGRFTVEIDDRVTDSAFYLICIGNGQYEGGGFRLVPSADPQDGLFDVCLVDPVSIPKVLRILPKVIAGKHTAESEVRIERGRRIRVKSDDGFAVHVDGENAGTTLTSVEVFVVPGGLRVLRGKPGRMWSDVSDNQYYVK
jgi:YegS/Rv2252/BmrU family lipid kinase